MGSTPTPATMSDPNKKFDFDWEPSEDVGELGKEYGNQPAGITPMDEDPDFIQRFQPKNDDPDVES